MKSNIGRVAPVAGYAGGAHGTATLVPETRIGWGYHVVRDSGKLPMPAECYWQMSDTVFWYGPC